MEISQSIIQLVNPILIVIICVLVIAGYRKGFLSKLLSLFSFVVIIIIAYYVAPLLAQYFEILPESWAPYQEGPLQEFFYTQANQWFIFALLVLATSVILFVLKPIILLIGELPLISTFNSLLGSLFGLIEGALFIFVLLIILHTPFISNGMEVIDSTLLKYADLFQVQLLGELESIDLSFIQEFDDSLIGEFKIYLEEHGISDEQISSFLESQVIQDE